MKKIGHLFLAIALCLLFASCTEYSREKDIRGIHAKVNDDLSTWTAGPGIHFSTSDATMSYWNLSIGASSGDLHQSILNNSYHWEGTIRYTEQIKHNESIKDNKCNYTTECTHTEGTTYQDQVYIDVYDSQKGWNEIYFRSFESTQVPNGAFTNTGQDHYYFIKTLRPDDFNALNVYSYPDMTYQFQFKTSDFNNFNAWTSEDMPFQWMSGQAKTCMLLVPMLVSIYQL